MNKPLMAVLIPFCIVATGALGYHYWDTGALPGMQPTFYPVSVEEIDGNDRGVHLEGTAHYRVELHQVFEDGERMLVFPLMARGDTLGREIKVLIRAQHETPDLVTYEDLVVKGLARPAGGRVGPKVVEALRGKGYSFADRVILVEAMEISGP